jgi:hypothetical protein
MLLAEPRRQVGGEFKEDVWYYLRWGNVVDLGGVIICQW